MPEQRRLFSFTTEGLGPETFKVVSFTGTDALSELFRFEIVLYSALKDLNPDRVVLKPAVFTLNGVAGDAPYRGIVVSFGCMRQEAGYALYRAVLAPRLWLLGLNRDNAIHLDMTFPKFLATTFETAALDDGVDLKLQRDYAARPYVCQYNETSLEFVSRWMERNGAYYFFDQDSGKAIVADTSNVHIPFPQLSVLEYFSPSGLASPQDEENVSRLALRLCPVPQSVMVKDWNYNTPELSVEAQAPVNPQGRGTVRYYGDNVLTPTEAKSLAEVRSQEFLCREKLYLGESGAPYLRAGYTFKLENHDDVALNQEYLTVSVEHEGNQSGYIISGLDAGDERESVGYRNRFVAIAAATQFRPERKTPASRFFGAMSATIDAAGTGEYAEVDEQGRYKVVLPFDRSGRKDGKASTWLRMAQPYGGDGHGMHFPLHKGTEVLLTFIDGDPDRPIVAGAAPNPESPSLVNNLNPSSCLIKSSGGNRLHMEDQDGNQRILMHCPVENSFVRMGSPNDPSASDEINTSDSEHNPAGITISSNQSVQFKVGIYNGLIMGNASATYLGLDLKHVVGLNTELIIGGDIGLMLSPENPLAETCPLKEKYFGAAAKAVLHKTAVSAQEDTLAGIETSIAGEITALGVEKTRLAGVETKITGELTTLATKIETLGQEKTKLLGEITTLAENKTKLAQTKADLAAQKVKLSSEKTTIADDIVRLAGQKVQLAEDITTLCNENTSLYGDVDGLSTSVEHLAATLIMM